MNRSVLSESNLILPWTTLPLAISIKRRRQPMKRTNDDVANRIFPIFFLSRFFFHDFVFVIDGLDKLVDLRVELDCDIYIYVRIIYIV